MAWWDDLWLNEAFATWMAFQIVDRWRPEWHMWHDFQHTRSAALGMDALADTHPIYTRVRTPAEATENFDLITYEKGASVVRMIERYLGEEAFRAGVRRYVRAHAESNAVAADLWRALEEASEREVEAVVRAWIEQPGFPLLRVQRRETAEGTELRFAQERFTARPQGAAKRAAGARAIWPIPWVGRLGLGGARTRTERHLIGKARARLTLAGKAPRFVYANADEGGFFRPLHEPEELAAIAAGLGALSAVERMGLVGHQWAHVKTGRAPLPDFLDLALAFGEEEDPDVLTALRAPLAYVVESAAQRLGEEAEAALRARIAQCFGPALDREGLDAGRDDSDDARLRRAARLALVGLVAERADLAEAASERTRRYLEDRRAIDPNLADLWVALAGAHGDEALFERYRRAAAEGGTPQERRRFLMALGSFRDRSLVDRALDLTLSDEVGTQDVAILMTRMLGNRFARERTWAFMKRRWKALRRRMPSLLVTRPIEATPALRTRAFRRDVAAFFKEHPVPTGRRAVQQALEQFDIGIAFDERAAPALRRWLDGGA
jgi:puromycin-sensitive aminopeptidase